MTIYKPGKREKALLILLLVFVFCFAGYRFVLAPQIRDYQRTRTELNEARDLVSRLSSRAGSLEEEKAALERAEKRLTELNNRFNTEMRDGQLIIQLSRIAEKNQVLVLKFKPLELIDKKFLLVLPVEIELRGLFPQVAAVISYLEELPNLSEIRNLQVTRYESESAAGQSTPGAAGSAAPSSIPDGTVTASMTLLIYSRPTPAARLEMEEIRRWAPGRPNPFLSGRVPVLPASPAQAAGTSDKELAPLPAPASLP